MVQNILNSQKEHRFKYDASSKAAQAMIAAKYKEQSVMNTSTIVTKVEPWKGISGMRVVPIAKINSNLGSGMNGNATRILEQKEIGTILGSSMTYSYIPYYSVVFPSMNNQQIAWDAAALRPATAEEVEKEDNRITELGKTVVERYKVQHVPYTKRIIESLANKNDLNTGYNFVNKGTWNEKTEKFTITQPHFMPTCCALTKCTEDLQVFIPTFWLQYYGYSILDMQRYLKFLENCELGFSAKYIGITKYEGSETVIFKQFLQDNSASKIPSTFVPQDEFHQIIIKRGISALQTYLFFITVRYLYNVAYWNIPATAMQIKFRLKDEITNFEALMLAHCRMNYNGYYCMCANSDSDKVDIYQNVKELMSRIKGSSGNSMNTSFKYVPISNKIHQLIEKADYKAAFNLFKSNKK